jgi:hypothetical protein
MVQEWKLPQYVVPDLTGFQVRTAPIELFTLIFWRRLPGRCSRDECCQRLTPLCHLLSLQLKPYVAHGPLPPK